MRSPLSWVRGGCVAALFACGGPATSPDQAVPIATVEGSTTSAPVVPPKAAARGLSHPDNDEEIVAVVRALLDCHKEKDASDCSAADMAAMLVDFEGKSATLSRLLDDPDERVRLFALEALMTADDWRGDEAIAEKVFAALEAPNVMYAMRAAEVVGCVDVRRTGTTERVKTLLHTTRGDVRFSLLRSLKPAQNPDLFDAIVAVATNPGEEEDMRMAAQSSFLGGVPEEKQAQACAMLSTSTRDPSERLALSAAEKLLAMAACDADQEALLKLADERTQGRIMTTGWPSFVHTMALNGPIVAKHGKELVTLGKRMATRSDNITDVRLLGLYTVVTADPKAGKAFARTLASDKDPAVQLAAKSMRD